MVRGHLWLEGDGCSVVIGQHSSFEAGVKLAAVEDGRAVTVGEHCMFSEDAQVRTSDSHSILSEGLRINPSADITIGDRVWVGNGAMLLKGAVVGSDSVVGARAVVTRDFPSEGVILAGMPARVIRAGVRWVR